jgi:hypothetical protein
MLLKMRYVFQLREAVRQKDRTTERQKDRKTERQKDRKKRDRKTVIQKGRETEIRKDSKTEQKIDSRHIPNLKQHNPSQYTYRTQQLFFFLTNRQQIDSHKRQCNKET